MGRVEHPTSKKGAHAAMTFLDPDERLWYLLKKKRGGEKDGGKEEDVRGMRKGGRSE